MLRQSGKRFADKSMRQTSNAVAYGLVAAEQSSALSVPARVPGRSGPACFSIARRYLRALSENDMTKAASLLFLSSALLGLIGSLTLAGAQGVPAPPSASVPPPNPAPAQRSSTTPSAKPAAPAKNAVDQ